MKKTLIVGILIALSFSQCGKKNDPFLIKNGSIGELTENIRMKQVDSIFAGDSIVKLNPAIDALSTQGEVEIYEAGGAKLLLLSPNNEYDPESYISNIQVFDDRYHSEKGLSRSSNFKFVKDNYTISSIESTISSIIVSLNESDIYVVIDKKQLPEDLRYDPSITIEASQIPDDATFKYFMIEWNYEEN